jgi:hypothetical protein
MQFIQRLCTEGLVWRQLHHPNVLPFLGIDGRTFKDITSLGLVSPWMERGTIMNYIKTNSYDASHDRMRLVSTSAITTPPFPEA